MDEFGDGVEIKFDHDIGAVRFSGVDADAEEGSHFLVGSAFGKELKDFALARSEPRTGTGGFRGGAGGLERGGNAGGEIGFVTTDGIDSGEQDAVGIIFEDVSSRAGFDDLLNEIVGFVHGEDKDFGIGRGFVNATCCLYTVEQRHTDIENGDVGLELGSFFDRVTAVGGFGADLPIGMGFEERAKASADNGMVVGDEDA